MCVSARNEMRKKIVCFAVRIMLVISMLTTAYAATSNPPPIYYEVWQCANGHQVKNWPDDYVIDSIDDLIYIAE